MPRSRAISFTRLRRQRARYWAAVAVTCGVGVIAGCGPASSVPAVNTASVPPSIGSPSADAYSGDPGPGWTLTWSDDFTGPSGLRNWTPLTGGNGWGNEELQVYDSRNVSLAPGGGLVITATRNGHGEQCWYGACTYSGARLQTKGSFEQKYGLFEARIKLPSGHGLWPAFWMEGADIDQVNWPASGEIDVIEVNNKKPGLVEAFAHAPGEKYGAYFQLPNSLSAGYHVYAIDWTAKGITWLVDGHAYGHISAYAGWPFDQPFFLILDLAVGGVWPGSPTAGTQFPAHMNVSWIRVYQQKS
jgi:beta-glucanase (GH16 family)